MKTFKILAVIAALFFTAGGALKGCNEFLHGISGLWDFLFVIATVGLLFCLAKLIGGQNKTT